MPTAAIRKEARYYAGELLTLLRAWGVSREVAINIGRELTLAAELTKPEEFAKDPFAGTGVQIPKPEIPSEN